MGISCNTPLAKKHHFQTIIFYTISTKNNVEIELSVQKYVDPCIFGSCIKIHHHFLEVGQQRYGRRAVREYPEYILNDNLKVVMISI